MIEGKFVNLRSLETYFEFKQRVFEHRDKFCNFLDKMKNDNKFYVRSI